jgi:CO/xanthine dehydrogenase FAD-binding subunit
VDLNTISEVVPARTRADLVGLRSTDGLLAGGTWLFSEPQDHLRRLVDLRTMAWPPLTVQPGGLEVAATCTIEQLVAACESGELPAEWSALPLARLCAQALLASFKIWRTATIGGNLCLGLPAGAMIAFAAALDARLLIWTPDGRQRTSTVVDFVTGAGQTALSAGEVLRSVTFPAEALAGRVAFRKVALAPLGRSGVVVIGRKDQSGEVTVCVTAATERPVVFRADQAVGAQLDAVDCWFDDPHGAPDWRAQVTRLLVAEVVEELG